MRKIAEAEVEKYRNNFLKGLVCYIPIAILIWVIPYVDGAKNFMTTVHIWRGNTLYVLIMLLFSSIVQFYMGYGFYISAFKSIRNGGANMDVLIAVGTTSAWLYGFILIFIGYPDDLVAAATGHHMNKAKHMQYHMEIHSHVHNFETSAILIVIVMLGKYIEAFSKLKTIDKLSSLASLKVQRANLVLVKDAAKLTLNAEFKEISVDLLALKDYVVVQPGGAVPTDGQVVLGRGCCNESMLTGESRPVQKEIGMKVFGGTILMQGSIILQVEKVAEDATFNQIMKMVENAQNTRAPIQSFADKISAVFVPTIIALAVLSWIVWFSLVYTRDIEQNKEHQSKF